MSRVIVFGADHRAAGEFQAQVTRGWALSGSSSLQGGLSTSIAVSAETARQDWLQFGRMVLVEEGKLTYLGNRSDHEFVFPPQHGFEWVRTHRDLHRSGQHPHISIGPAVC